MVRTGLRVLFACTCLTALASLSISVGHEPLYDAVLYDVNAVVLGLAGLLIASRLPRNPIGWVLSGMGLAAAWVELTEGYAYHPGWPQAAASEWVTNWGSMLGIGLTAVVLALFPTGRHLSAGRRVLVWSGVAATVMMMAGAAFGRGSDASFADGHNPHASDALTPVWVAGQLLFTLTLVAAIVSIGVRFRRSSRVERQQLKWVTYAVGLLAVVGPVAIFWYDESAAVRVAIAVVVTTWPVAICIAILRYRLYDIDVIISRTVVYGLLTAVLAAAYVTIVLVLGAAIGGRTPPWVTAGATLAVAVAFRPLRDRIQDTVDRRFRRARHTALNRIDTFLDDLRAGRTDPEGLTPLLREVMGQPGLQLRYLLPDTSAPADAEAFEAEAGWHQRVVERAGVPLAVVRCLEEEENDPHLLDEVLERAGLAIEIARLQAEVHHQLAEVEASRARIVAAGYEERRRLERDLHDGAQQRLVSVGLALRHAQHELGASPVVATIDAAIDQLADAIADLRELANGVRPAFLDHGLEVALRELAGRTPMPVEVQTSHERYPSDVEATAYFVACEALTNAVKHAEATSVEVYAAHADGVLVVTVHDNGVGGAHPSQGTGLRGLSDRVAAQGGRVHLLSLPGSGTTVTVELPCAS
jgi:signal transduction histidine kinase